MTKRYSPTKVTRMIFDTETQHWAELKIYEDATVRDQGTNNLVDAPFAMLRAYTPDINYYPQDYQKGNGLWWSEEEGYLLDCDHDIQLERISGIVLGRYSFGHGSERWTVLVSKDRYGEREERGLDPWNDASPYDKEHRFEEWHVMLAKEEDSRCD